MGERLGVFGIRHHGPGSAASLLAALEAFEPARVLIEGPPEANALIPLASAPGMRPPLAILTYPASEPEHARFFPFAEFSPEWCAMRWANERGVAACFIDLPMPKSEKRRGEASETRHDDGDADASERAPAEADEPELDPGCESGSDAPVGQIHRDPLTALAVAAGHSDGEAWWNAIVEQSEHAPAVFDAILDAMAALREASEEGVADRKRASDDERREAFMRQQIRAALSEVEGRVAVVCGAWHAPALESDRSATQDRAVLKGYKKASKVEACWVPWTDPRLAAMSGYEAGVVSPGWYSHLWRMFESDASARSIESVARWQGLVARALRQADIDAATSSVIDATRLAIGLASIRGHAVPGLREMHDASLAALCAGHESRLRVVENRLVVGDRVGVVDDAAPQPPLLADLQRQQRRLRLEPSAEAKDVALDLRTAAGMAKSELFWRLQLIDVEWGYLVDASAGRGTFREIWRLEWTPELSVKLAEAVVWGATIEQASRHAASQKAVQLDSPTELATLVRTCLMASIEDSAQLAIRALQELAVEVGSRLGDLMSATPRLIEVIRYGTAREMPLGPLRRLIDHIIVEVATCLVHVCCGIDDEEATALAKVLRDFDVGVELLDDAVRSEQWQRGLAGLCDHDGAAPRLRGLALRILHDRGAREIETTARLLSLALSPSVPIDEAGQWLEGFLAGSGDVLLHDPALLAAVDEWIVAQSPEVFLEILPMLRRGFCEFDATLRRRMLREVEEGLAAGSREVTADRDDASGAEAFRRAEPLLREILGLPVVDS